MWIDIVDDKLAKSNPMLDISPPPAVKYELRVIIWKVTGCVSKDGWTKMNDLYVRVQYNNQPVQTTDTHWRAKGGIGSFNWRCKFPLELGTFLPPQRLTLQIWDRDVIKYSDHIGEAVLNLRPWLRRIRHGASADPNQLNYYELPKELSSKFKSPNADSMTDIVDYIMTSDVGALVSGGVEDDLKRFWMPVFTPARLEEPQGWIYLSTEVILAEDTKVRRAGFGREDPNMNPILPKPSGRINFTLNPCTDLYQLLGFTGCSKAACAVCTLISILIAYYTFPVILGNLLV